MFGITRTSRTPSPAASCRQQGAVGGGAVMAGSSRCHGDGHSRRAPPRRRPAACSPSHPCLERLQRDAGGDGHDGVPVLQVRPHLQPGASGRSARQRSGSGLERRPRGAPANWQQGRAGRPARRRWWFSRVVRGEDPWRDHSAHLAQHHRHILRLHCDEDDVSGLDHLLAGREQQRAQRW